MMNRHNFALLGTILVVVVISGCINQGTTTISGTKGVIIKSFAPDISEIYSGDAVIFNAEVENVGEERATGVTLKLFGLGTDWGEENDDWYDPADRINTEIGILEKSQPDDGVQGGFADAQWEATSPAGLKVDNTYTASVRLYYIYRTTAHANVKVYSNEYLRTNVEEAEGIMQSSGIDTFAVTDAPITIELSGLSKPLIYRGSGQQSSMTVLMSNVGGGKPYLSTDESKAYVEIVSMKVAGETCVDDVADNYRLPRSGSKSVTCKFNLPEVDSYTTIPVDISLRYNYFTDSTTSVKVLKSLYIGEDEPIANGNGNGENGEDEGVPFEGSP